MIKQKQSHCVCTHIHCVYDKQLELKCQLSIQRLRIWVEYYNIHAYCCSTFVWHSIGCVYLLFYSVQNKMHFFHMVFVQWAFLKLNYRLTLFWLSLSIHVDFESWKSFLFNLIKIMRSHQKCFVCMRSYIMYYIKFQ